MMPFAARLPRPETACCRYVEIVHADAAASVAVQEREERNALPARRDRCLTSPEYTREIDDYYARYTM